jgi:ribose transport system substrate-binding protein
MTDAAKAEMAKHPGYSLSVQAPERAVDVARQMDLIDNLIAQHVAALCIVPADSKGIIPAIARANRSNVPVLILDNKIDKDLADKTGIRTVTFIGSDNFAGGRAAGEYMIRKLPLGGHVAILEGVSGVDAATQRKAGFLAALQSASNIKVVASQPADWDREKGLNAFQNMLQADAAIRGLFACNDEMALGAVQAIHAAHLDGKILVVGFDAIKDSLNAIRARTMDATIAQLPAEVGRLGIINAIKVTQGETIPPSIPTAIKLIDISNVDTTR